jgi:hypothetical protein
MMMMNSLTPLGGGTYNYDISKLQSASTNTSGLTPEEAARRMELAAQLKAYKRALGQQYQIQGVGEDGEKGLNLTTNLKSQLEQQVALTAGQKTVFSQALDQINQSGWKASEPLNAPLNNVGGGILTPQQLAEQQQQLMAASGLQQVQSTLLAAVKAKRKDSKNTASVTGEEVNAFLADPANKVAIDTLYKQATAATTQFNNLIEANKAAANGVTTPASSSAAVNINDEKTRQMLRNTGTGVVITSAMAAPTAQQVAVNLTFDGKPQRTTLDSKNQRIVGKTTYKGFNAVIIQTKNAKGEKTQLLRVLDTRKEQMRVKDIPIDPKKHVKASNSLTPAETLDAAKLQSFDYARDLKAALQEDQSRSYAKKLDKEGNPVGDLVRFEGNIADAALKAQQNEQGQVRTPQFTASYKNNEYTFSYNGQTYTLPDHVLLPGSSNGFEKEGVVENGQQRIVVKDFAKFEAWLATQQKQQITTTTNKLKDIDKNDQYDPAAFNNLLKAEHQLIDPSKLEIKAVDAENKTITLKDGTVLSDVAVGTDGRLAAKTTRGSDQAEAKAKVTKALNEPKEGDSKTITVWGIDGKQKKLPRSEVLDTETLTGQGGAKKIQANDGVYYLNQTDAQKAKALIDKAAAEANNKPKSKS